jgi:hypothetical protein
MLDEADGAEVQMWGNIRAITGKNREMNILYLGKTLALGC